MSDVLPDKDINDLIDFSYKERGRVVTMSEMKAERDSSVLPAELMKHAQTSIGIYDIVDKIINFEDVTDDANKFRKDLWLPVSAVTEHTFGKEAVKTVILNSADEIIERILLPKSPILLGMQRLDELAFVYSKLFGITINEARKEVSEGKRE